MNLQRKPKIVSTLLCASLLAICATARAEVMIRVGGTGSGLASIKMLAKAYQKGHPGVTIKVLPSLGSGGGIAAVAQGALDIAVSARPLKESELSTGAVATEYARTPFVLCVHRTVPQKDLTTKDLVNIYSGKLDTWPNGTLIRLILRPPNDIDTGLVSQLSPAVARAVEQAHARRGMTLAITNQESDDAVSSIPGALGTSTLSEIVAERRKIKILSINGVKPTLRSMNAGIYPLVKRLYLVTPAKPSPQAQQFARFVRSAKGKDILLAAGTVPSSATRER